MEPLDSFNLTGLEFLISYPGKDLNVVIVVLILVFFFFIKQCNYAWANVTFIAERFLSSKITLAI